MSRRKRRRSGLKRNFAFVRRYSRVPRPLLRRAWGILRHRHSLVHSAEIKGSITPDGREEVRAVHFHVIGPEMIPVAMECLDTAERTVAALREAVSEPGWSPFA